MTTRKLPPPPPGSERRRHTRHEILAQIDLRRGTDVWVVKVSNISAGGLFVEPDTRQMVGLKVGDSVTVYIDMGNDPAGQPLAFESGADVVRVDYGGPERPAGLGLMWTSSDSKVVEALSRVLRQVESQRNEDVGR